MDRYDQSQHASRHLPEHVRKNLAMWEAISDSYQQTHDTALSGEHAMAWSLWRIPEAQLQILGDVVGKDILEIGCGAARWSIALAQHGARPVGLDISPQQLAHARRFMAETNIDFPLIEASAEDIPLPAAGFDIIFGDWGAMTFCDPYRTVPEAARLLRPDGIFAFATATPFQFVCLDMQTDRTERHLINDYFGMHHIEFDDSVDFHLSYGDWIRLFRRNALIVEDLIETRPAKGATSTYRSAEESEWATHWPMENIWKLRKA